jgi:hypothetical protein
LPTIGVATSWSGDGGVLSYTRISVFGPSVSLRIAQMDSNVISITPTAIAPAAAMAINADTLNNRRDVCTTSAGAGAGASAAAPGALNGGPQSSLLPKYELLSNRRKPFVSGILPESSLYETLNLVKFTRLPKLAGIVPFKRLYCKRSACKADKEPSSGRMLPVRLFADKSLPHKETSSIRPRVEMR